MNDDKRVNSKKQLRRLLVSILVFIILLTLTYKTYFIWKNVDHIQQLGFKYKPSKESLIAKEFSGNEVDGQRFVAVYQEKNKIIINAYSDFKSDKPNQIVHEIDYKIKPEDIKFTWIDFLENAVDKNDNNIIYIQVDVFRDDKIVLTEKFSFVEKSVEAVNDYFKKTKP